MGTGMGMGTNSHTCTCSKTCAKPAGIPVPVMFTTGIHPSDPSDVEAPLPWGVVVFPPIFPFQIEFQVCTWTLPPLKNEWCAGGHHECTEDNPSKCDTKIILHCSHVNKCSKMCKES